MQLGKLGNQYHNAKSWDESTRTLMLASKQLVILPPEQRCSMYEIKGCESPVWFKFLIENNRVFVQAYSDGKIIRGLIYLILEPIQAVTKDVFCSFDFDAYLTQLALTKYLSPTRTHGISSLINALKSYQLH